MLRTIIVSNSLSLILMFLVMFFGGKPPKNFKEGYKMVLKYLPYCIISALITTLILGLGEM